MKYYKVLPILIGLFFITLKSFSQEEKRANREIGIELQVYPTGVIPGLRYEHYLSNTDALNFRLGYQFIDHRDLGVQENETGSGYGGSVAYRKFFTHIDKGFSLALRSDVWFNSIDWETGRLAGNTEIIVLQPTLMAEYVFRSDNLVITPQLSFGFEWNIQTDGEPTGQGAIVLLGVTFGLRS